MRRMDTSLASRGGWRGCSERAEDAEAAKHAQDGGVLPERKLDVVGQDRKEVDDAVER